MNLQLARRSNINLFRAVTEVYRSSIDVLTVKSDSAIGAAWDGGNLLWVETTNCEQSERSLTRKTAQPGAQKKKSPWGATEVGSTTFLAASGLSLI